MPARMSDADAVMRISVASLGHGRRVLLYQEPKDRFQWAVGVSRKLKKNRKITPTFFVNSNWWRGWRSKVG